MANCLYCNSYVNLQHSINNKRRFVCKNCDIIYFLEKEKVIYSELIKRFSPSNELYAIYNNSFYFQIYTEKKFIFECESDSLYKLHPFLCKNTPIDILVKNFLLLQ